MNIEKSTQFTYARMCTHCEKKIGEGVFEQQAVTSWLINNVSVF